MKSVFYLVLLNIAIGSTHTWAQTTTAYDSANCAASFLRGCVDDTSATSETSAAPVPIVGAGLAEGGALALAGVYWWRRRKAMRGQSREAK